MRRSKPQDTNPVSLLPTGSQQKLCSLKWVIWATHPQFPTSATIVGLALSVGVVSILLPHRSAQAHVSEPLVSLQPYTTIDPSSFVNTSITTSVESVAPLASAQPLLAEPAIAGVINASPFLGSGTVAEAPVRSAVELKPAAVSTSLPFLLSSPKAEVPVKLDTSLSSAHSVVIGPEVTIAAVASPIAAFSIDTAATAKPDNLSSSTQSVVVAPAVATQNSLPSGKTPVSSVALDQLNPDKPIAADKELAQSVIANVASVPVTTNLSEYQVKPGDTLETISSSHQVSKQALMKANQLDDADVLSAGQALKISAPQLQELREPESTFELPTVTSKEATSIKIAAVPPSVDSKGSLSDVSIPTIPKTTRSRSDLWTTVASHPQASSREPLETRNSKEATSETAIGKLPQQDSWETLSSTPDDYVAIVKRTILPQLSRLELPPLAPAKTYLPTVPVNGLAGSNQYNWPAKGILTSGYGRRWGRMHRGIDIAAPVGTPIAAAASGIVVESGWNSGGYGNLVEIRHLDGSLTVYAHNKRLLARVGQQVDQGQQIAELGNTGRSTGPHLHFEIHPFGKGAVNPVPYLAQRN
ncbi:MAG TPA: peptidoglycan DD-metalloendopeptidase family protein [Candidatus Caenarcaniphilales bacterium]